MPIAVVCPGCQKTLRAAEKLAGKRVKCPGCGGAISIPAAVGQSPRPAAPVPDPGPGPAGSTATPSFDWWDDFDDATPGARILPPVPTAALSPPPAAAATPTTPPTRSVPRPAPQQARPRFRSLALLLVLVPLGLQMLGTAEDVEVRLQKMLDSDPDFAARYAVIEAAPAGEVDADDLFAALPGGRIVGAHLPRDTYVHWVYAVVAAVVLLAAVRLLFEPGGSTVLQLAGALAITATAGIVSLLIFQFLAELSQGLWVRGRGILVVPFFIVKLIGFSYRAALDPENGFLLSFFGFTMGVGLCEEFVKLIPATGLMKQGRCDWRGACALGLASGIGFGVAEGIMYSSDYYNGVAYGDVYLTRFVSCVGLHAIWTGAAAVLAAHQWRSFESNDTSDMAIAGLKAIAVPAILHGLYDTLLKRDLEAWALVTAVVSFAWLVGVIEHARWSEAAQERDSFAAA